MIGSEVVPLPLLSMSPTDWSVYADFASEHPDAHFTEDKARRIAYILKNWWPRERQWLRISLQPSYMQRSYRSRTSWVWHLPDPVIMAVIRDPNTTAYDNNSAAKFLRIQILTNDGNIAPYCNPTTKQQQFTMNYHRVLVKFFNTILYPENTSRLLRNSGKWREYCELFNYSKIRMTLGQAIEQKLKHVRRVCWVRGERLTLENHEAVPQLDGNFGMSADAWFNDPNLPSQVFPLKMHFACVSSRRGRNAHYRWQRLPSSAFWHDYIHPQADDFIPA